MVLTIIGALAAILIIWLITAGVNARRVRVEQIEIKSKNLPQAFDGTRLIFLSDIHAGPFLSQSRVAQLVDTVNKLGPDLLILGGDNVGGHAQGDSLFYPEAKRFKARLSRLAVLGNHDVREGAGNARRGLAQAGFTLLENEAAAVEKDGYRIFVAGLEDRWTSEPDVVKTAAGISPDDFAVLVTHNPDELSVALPATPGLWDLALAGHVHGGQVLLFGRGFTRPTEFGKRYRTGWRTECGVPILVSNGVGTVILPLRSRARPEIHVLILKVEAGGSTRETRDTAPEQKHAEEKRRPGVHDPMTLR